MTARVWTLETSQPIDSDLAAALEKEAVWVSTRVRDVHVDGSERRVRFCVDGDRDIDAERAKVARFVTDMLDRHRPLPRRVVAQRRRGECVLHPDAFAELVRRGWVVPMARGCAALRGPALAVVRSLDEECARLAREVFGAEEEAHPALASTSLLARCGWFGSFPHAASFVAHLTEDYDTIDRFRSDNAHGAAFVPPDARALAPVEACVLPALCYSVFAAREGTTVTSEFAAITCAGRCFRYESRNLVGLERLWDFGMREAVFLGSAENVAAARRKALDCVLAQLDRWDLDGTFETANDPFFPAVRAPRAYWQQSGERKIELSLPVAAGPEGRRSIACASFNLHDQFFGTTFGIAVTGGAPAASGCVGWGMERWMLACFAQHGFDPEGWPSWLRNRTFR